MSLIDGHMQDRYNPGIFKNLSKLKAGAKFSVELGVRSRRQQRVSIARALAKTDKTFQLSDGRPAARGRSCGSKSIKGV